MKRSDRGIEGIVGDLIRLPVQETVHHRAHVVPLGTTGVVDPNCRVHGLDNLYIAGSSVFPTGGYANPTLTLVALAVRLSEHLDQQVRRQS